MLAAKAQLLDSLLHELAPVAVAFSGGADSALALAAAVRVSGADQTIAVTVKSPAVASGEAAAASSFAAELGVAHFIAAGAELSRPGYQNNGRDRCAHCKTELMEVIKPIALRELGSAATVITGTNADDVLDPHRPGIAAARTLGARTPLADAGLTKAEVRQLSRLWQLPTWNKPQAACLASRIAYGVEVTGAALTRVDAAETATRAALRELHIAVTDLRVRDLGNDRARVEIDADLVEIARPHWPRIATAIRATGFHDVALDPAGFRSGSLNLITGMSLPVRGG